jgi:Zn-dependent M32 family carboxypeptidase
LPTPKARLIDPSSDPYDVLLDDYEKGLTAARLDEIFAEVGGRSRCFE